MTNRQPIDPALIEAAWVIDTADGPRHYVDVRDDWQAADDAAMMPAVRKVVGLPNASPPITKAYLERSRGHDKTGTLARLAATMLISSPRQIVGAWSAATFNQAQLGRHAIDRLCRMTPVAAQFLEVQQSRVIAKETGSRLDFLTSDGPTQFGRTDDFLIADELTIWPDVSGEELWGAIFSSVPKRGAFICVITNAGFDAGHSWQWKVRESFREDSDCYFSSQPGCIASWISPSELAFQERTLARPTYQRVWQNLWLLGGQGEAFDRATIDALCQLRGQLPCRLSSFGAVVLSVDLGWRNDHAAVTTLGVEQWTDQVCVANVESWSPQQHGGEIDLQVVEEAIEHGVRKYEADFVIFDDSQAVLMRQRLARRGISVSSFTSGSKMHNAMAKSFIDSVRNNRLVLYPHDELCRDLTRISIVEKPTGLYVNAQRDEKTGHCDRGMALIQCLPSCFELMPMLRTPAEEFETRFTPIHV